MALAAGPLAAPASAEPTPGAGAAPVADELRAAMGTANGEPVQALLMLDNPADYDMAPADVVSSLRAHAGETQEEVELALEQQAETQGNVRVLNRFWITNMILVEFSGTGETLSALSETPGVRRVLPNFTLSAPEPDLHAASEPGATIIDDRITWGVDRIGAERVWNELGLDGTGVRVVTLDTGVDISHPDLAGKMATDRPGDPQYPGGWMEFDASGNLVASEPHDSAYHGTHVSGTIHGGSASGVIIGVAPGAQMAHGLVIPGGSGSFAQVAAGMQWAIAPTDAAGNPAGRPADVVNMSLGANSYVEEMIAPTRAMVAAGTFPAFAIGNAGLFGCGVGSASPGNVYEAVGVGATDVNDDVASFSCGNVVEKADWTDPPASWPDTYVTPDLSAPGDEVWSAEPGGGYQYLSGTSMATPHTAGTAALLTQGAPELTVDQMRQFLLDTAFWEPRYSPTRPDTRYGGGRIDAYAAVSQAAVDSGITGLVTATGSGAPVAGATIVVEPGGNTVKSNGDGRYTVRLVPGTYSLTASAFGHEPGSVSGISVTDDTFTTADIPLTPQPTGTISGAATFSESGHGIPGVSVSVLDIPVDRTAVTALDGSYSIQVPVGTYRVAADHAEFVGPEPVEVVVTAGGTATADFAFSPPPQTIAIVGDYGQEYADLVFGPRGVETVRYDWPELVDAAQHPLVILTYGFSSDYNAERFQAFLDATDASGAGVIFTDHAFGTGSGLKQLSRHTGQPASTDTLTGGSGVDRSYYQVTATHPILGEAAVGDQINLDTSTQAKWIAWFDGYEGEGRQIIADLGRSDSTGIYGGGIAVQQRPGNRHVLMSTHGVSATRGPEDWTPEATQLFLNAVNWAARPATPGQPYFALHSLDISPDTVKIDEPVTVRVQVKNVGASSGQYQAVLRINGEVEATSTATIGSGSNRTFTWTVSRDELGTYAVQVGYLNDSFRIRPPRVALTAKTVDSPEADPGPLAGATVELIHEGAVIPVGTTAADGTLTFDAPEAIGRYTLVVRKPVAGDSEGYLLHRVITVIDDDQVEFAPRVLASGLAAASIGENFAARVTLAFDSADAQHDALTYLRPSTTAPWSYAYAPGTVITTLDTYEAVNVHKVTRLEQDWWLPGEIVSGLEWIDPFDVRYAFGGEAQVHLAATREPESTVRVDWDVTDAHGNPFATVLAGDVRPFLDLPAVLRLEDVLATVRAEAPNEELPILRLFAPDGTALRAGSIAWNAQPFSFQVPDPQAGAYRIGLDLDTGTYSGQVSAETSVVLLDEAWAQMTYPDTAYTSTWFRHEVSVTNPSTADLGTASWTVNVEHASANLRAKDVVLQIHVDGRWERVSLTADGGRLTGTVRSDVDLGSGADHTWRLRTKVRVDGQVTFTNLFQGAETGATVGDTVTVTPEPELYRVWGEHALV